VALIASHDAQNDQKTMLCQRMRESLSLRQHCFHVMQCREAGDQILSKRFWRNAYDHIHLVCRYSSLEHRREAGE
jgi:hypothetical protein